LSTFRKIIPILLLLLACSFQLQAQINRLRGSSAEEDEPSGTDSQSTEKSKEAMSPDTAKCSYFISNYQASHTLIPFKAYLHNFSDYTPIQRGNDMYAFLGNPGSASTLITYRLNNPMGFTYIHGAFDMYKISMDSVKFYAPEKPFSEINYVMGKLKEQQLQFTLSQEVRKGLTLGIFARFANTPGMYQRQRTYYSSGYLTARYVTESQRYGASAFVLTDRFRNYENGGLAYDSIFTQNLETNRQTIAVRLSNAMNRDKSLGYYFQQYLNLQKPRIVKDSSGTFRQVAPKFNAGRIIHTFKYYRQTTAYEDDKSQNGVAFGFYPVIYGDTTKTLDSTFRIHIENSFVYSNIEPDTAARNFPFQYSFGISQQYDKIGFGYINQITNLLDPASVFSGTEIVSRRIQDESFNQLIPFGTLKGIIARKTFFIANGRLSLGGYNSGDNELSGNFYQFFKFLNKPGKISLTAIKGQNHPDYFFHRFFSDHFRWENNFKLQDYTQGRLSVEVAGLFASFGITRLNNYTWLNSSINPQQSSSAIFISRADLSKVFHPGHWILDTRLTWQEVSKDSVIQLPSLAGKASISYNMFLFKKVLHAQIGIGCQYYTKYYADAYHPELRMFYRQDQFQSGDYPYLDAFLNMRIKRARLFIKYQHMNAGWIDHSYFMVPHYPGADAALKAGVSWVFYD
jgi:hypothetical protein